MPQIPLIFSDPQLLYLLAVTWKSEHCICSWSSEPQHVKDASCLELVRRILSYEKHILDGGLHLRI